MKWFSYDAIALSRSGETSITVNVDGQVAVMALSSDKRALLGDRKVATVDSYVFAYGDAVSVSVSGATIPINGALVVDTTNGVNVNVEEISAVLRGLFRAVG